MDDFTPNLNAIDLAVARNGSVGEICNELKWSLPGIAWGSPATIANIFVECKHRFGAYQNSSGVWL